MAGGAMKYRHLGRSSSHRQALLRNLVTSLFKHESISTTYPKAKEAQRLAEKLITLGKKNTEASRRRALSIFYTPHELLPKLFGPIRERYAERPGGYTRILRIEPLKEDQAPSAILELVDGPKDMRFAMTAMTVARQGKDVTEMTQRNIEKVTRFRAGGMDALDEMVEKLKKVGLMVKKERNDAVGVSRKRASPYPQDKKKKEDDDKERRKEMWKKKKELEKLAEKEEKILEAEERKGKKTVEG